VGMVTLRLALVCGHGYTEVSIGGWAWLHGGGFMVNIHTLKFTSGNGKAVF